MSTTVLDERVPKWLRLWFVIHFVADILVALPLFVCPVLLFETFGWENVDPYASRIVAAALFGIGVESLLGRKADASAFLAMLNLKVIWSGVTVLGLVWTLIEYPSNRPLGAWIVLGTFLVFHSVWVYWRLNLGKRLANEGLA